MKLKEELKQKRANRPEDLKKELVLEKQKVASTLLSIRAGKSEKYSEAKKLKKNIARIETIIKEMTNKE
ncbi:MAG: 50S ribosomal protein L29 [Patescibacteria group bacterium]